MDSIVRLIEAGIQSLINLLQPTLNDGSYGYLFALVVLVGVAVFALRSKNGVHRVGLILGVLVGLGFIYVYDRGNGDNVLLPLVASAYPDEGLFTPALLGLFTGLVILLPLGRAPVTEKSAPIVAALTAGALIMLYIFWRVSSVSPEVLRRVVPTAQAYQKEIMTQYLRRVLSIFTFTFVIGVLFHILLSHASAPPPKK